MKKYNVLLIEDDEAYQDMCTQGLANHNIQTIIAGNGEDGLKILRDRDKEVDLVLLDYYLPDGLGINFLVDIIRLRPKIPVIILTAVEELEPSVRAQLIKLGAEDFVIKPMEYVELAARIGARIERPETDVTQYQFGGWILDLQGRRLVDPDGVTVSLTAEEWDILLKFLQNPGTVISRDDLGRQLHNPDLLNRKISSLRRKLHDGGEKFIATVHRQGYQFRMMDVTVS